MMVTLMVFVCSLVGVQVTVGYSMVRVFSLDFFQRGPWSGRFGGAEAGILVG